MIEVNPCSCASLSAVPGGFPRCARPGCRSVRLRAVTTAASRAHARERDALLLTSRQHSGRVTETVPQTDPPQSFRPLPSFDWRRVSTSHGHLGILEGGKFGEQVVELKDESDVLISKRKFTIFQRREVDVADPHFSSVALVEAAENGRSVLFPTPDAPTIAIIAPVDREVQTSQHRQLTRADDVTLAKILYFDKRHEITDTEVRPPGRVRPRAAKDKSSRRNRSESPTPRR